MSHPEQKLFIKLVSEKLGSQFDGKQILEVGSYQVNGDIRSLFPGSNYIGVDVAAGPGVDLVADGHLVDLPDGSCDITISCECFEHNPYWSETLLNMIRMTKEGGVVVCTCATKGRVEHGTTRSSPNASPGTYSIGWDYYKNLDISDFKNSIPLGTFKKQIFYKNIWTRDLYFIGIRTGSHGYDFDEKYFYRRISREQSRLFWTKMFSPLNFVSHLVYIPLRTLMVFPEKLFQNIAVPYINAAVKLQLFLRSLIVNNK